MKVVKLQLTYRVPDKLKVKELSGRVRRHLDGMLFVTDKEFFYQKKPTVKVVK